MTGSGENSQTDARIDRTAHDIESERHIPENSFIEREQGGVWSNVGRADRRDSADPLWLYKQDVGRIPLLTRAQETTLALRSASGDETAERQLFEANLRLVINIAGTRFGQGLDESDLVQEGNLGLRRALKTFDPQKGRLSTYATPYIRQAMDIALVERGNTIGIPIATMRGLRRLNRFERNFYQENHCWPTAEQTEQIYGRIPESVWLAREVGAGRAASLDSPIEEGEVETYGDLFADPAADDPELMTEQAVLTELLQECLSILTPEERKVMELLYGFRVTIWWKDYMIREIKEETGYFREKIRSMEAASLKKIRSSPQGQKLWEFLHPDDATAQESYP